MDEMNAEIIKALYLVSTVQSCCDQQRRALEFHFKAEVNKRAEELKQKELEKEEEQQQQEQNDDSEESDCEELELADKLLRKAKYIREKYKMPNLSPAGKLVKQVQPATKDSSSRSQCKNPKSVRTECKVRQSRSAPLMLKATAQSCGTRRASQSAKDRKLPRVPNIQSRSESNIPVQTAKKNSRGTGAKPKPDYVVLTKKQYLEFKNLKGEVAELIKDVSSSTSNAGEVTTMNNNQVGKMCTDVGKFSGCNSDWKGKIHNARSALASSVVQKLPNISVKQVLQSCSDIPFGGAELNISFLNYFWYPFISSENKTRLTVRVACRNTEEFRNIVTLYHKIQEAMFWIDFFTRIGTKVASFVQGVDQSDPEFALVISCIQSIFHEHLQRIPVIFNRPNDVEENRMSKYFK